MTSDTRWAVARVIFACGLIAVVVLGFARVSLPDYRASDDNIWFYFVGLATTMPEASGRDPEAQLTDTVREMGAEHDAVVRYELRLGYRHNYLLPLAVWGATRALFDARAAASGEAYAEKVGWSVLLGSALSHALATLALTIGLLVAQRTDLVAGAFGGLSILLALTFIVPSGGAFLFWEQGGWDSFSNALLFALRPDPQYNVFGFTPRSQIALLALLAFSLRWRGWIGGGYAVLALSALVHQSMAALIFSVVVLMDLVLRPSVLRSPSVWPFIVLGVLLIVARETLWGFVLAPAALERLAIVMVAVGIVTVIARVALQRGYSIWLQSLRDRVAAAPLYVVDASVVGLGWIATLPLGYVLARNADPLQRLYFWSQVHSRTWMLIAPVIASAIVLVVWHGLSKTTLAKRAATYPIAAALLAVGLLIVPFSLAIRPIAVASAEIQRFQAQMRDVGSKLEAPLGHVPTIDDEAVLYLGLVRQRDTGEPALQRLLPRSTGPGN